MSRNINGEGSIYQRKDGRWVAAACVPRGCTSCPGSGRRSLLSWECATSVSGQPGEPWPPAGYVFGYRHGTPLEPRNLTRMWCELCAQHGIRKVQLHGLRHTCVSLLLALGVHPRTVMEIVGHSAIEMTMNVYGHVNLDAQRRALDELDDQLSRGHCCQRRLSEARSEDRNSS